MKSKESDEGVLKKIAELDASAVKRKAKQLTFWSNISSKKLKVVEDVDDVKPTTSQHIPEVIDEKVGNSTNTYKDNEEELFPPFPNHARKYQKPAEMQHKKTLDDINADIAHNSVKQMKGLGDSQAVAKDLKLLHEK